MKIKDYLENKNVLFFGDSITHNWFEHDHDLNKIENYDGKSMSGYVGVILDNTNPKSLVNVAVSGGCYADVSKTFSYRQEFRHFPYQIDHALDKIKSADVIFIFFGANDYACQTPFGKFDELTTAQNSTTLYSGMNFGFDKIKKINPLAKIFVLTILNRSCPIDVTTFNYSINEYNLAIKHAANRYGATIIDINPLFKLDENYPGTNGPIYTDDGLHPNDKGSKVIADFILNFDI